MAFAVTCVDILLQSPSTEVEAVEIEGKEFWLRVTEFRRLRRILEPLRRTSCPKEL